MAFFTIGKIKENIRLNLTILTTLVKLNTAVGHTDINHEAEDFYCGLLNSAFGWNLINQNVLQMNFPAIDLGDPDATLPDGRKGIAVQVTSTKDRAKVQDTLDRFFQNQQESKFQRLIVLIIGEKPRYQGDFDLKGNLNFDKGEDIWDTEALLQKLEALGNDRLAAVDAYLEEQFPLHRAKTRIMDLPVSSALPASGFIGREDLLEKIAEDLEGGTKPVFLTGLGGIGKTELAVRFGRKYKHGNVYMVSFMESFRKTLVQNVATGIPNLLDQKLSEEEIYARVLHHLGKLSDQDVLIIDNADGDGTDFTALMDEAYDALCKLDVKLIITTRCTRPMAVKVDVLKNEQLYELFVKHEVTDITEAEMDRLIESVRGHTMTVDLMARTMKESFVSVEQMLTAMATGGMDEDFEAVGTFHNETREQQRIDGHLLALFRVAGMDENARKLLSCAVLLPQGGMDYDTFKKALPEGAAGAIKGQVNRGWLGRDRGTRLVTIHPVLRLVCRTALENWREICPEFLTRLHEQQEEKDFRLDVYRQLAEVYIAAVAEEIPTDRAMWHYLAAWYLEKQGQYREALEYEQEALNRRQTLLDANDLDLAHTYNDIGVLFGYQGDHKKALEYKGKALEIRKQALPGNHPDLATSYDNVGNTYGNLGDHQKALEYHEKAMDIRKQALPENHPDLARSYNNVGTTYGDLGDHQMELEYQEKALEIRKQAFPENHPDLANSYNNMGVTYSDLGDHQKALEYQEKALEIRKAVLTENHPDLETSYNNVGNTYDDLGDHQKALEYKEKALEIRKAALPANHPDLATSYGSIAWTYKEMGDYRNALNYCQEAIKLAKRNSSSDPKNLESLKSFEKQLKRILR